MFKRMLLMAAAVHLLSVQIYSQEIGAPKLTPVPTSEKHDKIIRDGVALHERGDYAGAIGKYQEVLSESPGDIFALHELGFSLFANKDYKKSLEVGLKGARYKSKSLAHFYVLIGNSLDHLKERDKAINAYKSGIKLFPDEAQLHFNLAVTYIGGNKLDEAKESLKVAVASDPNHRSGHFGLAQLYDVGGYKIPVVLALSRFLVLEPSSPRSGPALQRLHFLMEGGASKKEGESVTIFVDPSAKKDEGDFSTFDLALSLFSASRHIEKNKNRSQMQSIVDDFTSLFGMLSGPEAGKRQQGFAWNYYRPYFAEMKARNYVEPFCYYIHQSANSEEVANWLTKNYGKVNEFLSWSKSFQWPKEK
jgi:tetratricopeptide (TPR) repeat protein